MGDGGVDSGGSCTVVESVAIDPPGSEVRSWFPVAGLVFPTRIVEAVPISVEEVEITAPSANNFMSWSLRDRINTPQESNAATVNP